MRALPFAVGAGHESAVKPSKPLTRSAQLFVAGHLAGGNKHSEEALFASVGIYLAAKILCDFLCRNRNLHHSLIAQIHLGGTPFDSRKRVRLAALAAAHSI